GLARTDARAARLHAEHASEAPCGVVGLRAVVIDPDRSESVVAEDRAAEVPDLRRCEQPAGRLRIELAQLLETPVLGFIQEHGTHGLGQLDRARFRPVLLPRFQRLAVVADAPAPRRTLGGAVEEEVLAGGWVPAGDIGFAAAPF